MIKNRIKSSLEYSYARSSLKWHPIQAGFFESTFAIFLQELLVFVKALWLTMCPIGALVCHGGSLGWSRTSPADP